MRLSSRHLAVLLPLCASLMADTPTIQNGDFETPQIPRAPFVTFGPVPGWMHSGSLGIGNLVGVGYADGGGTCSVAGHGAQFIVLGAGFQTRGDAAWSTNITGLQGICASPRFFREMNTSLP
jgi:hypothetical protein